MKHLTAAGAFALLASVRLATAQTIVAPPGGDPHGGNLPGEDPLTEIVVTATRTAQPANQALEPVIVVDRAALENSLATDIGDVLRLQAGLDIGRNGGPGQPLSLFIRGANSNQSIIMIDGVRVNAGTSGLAPLTNVAPELFDRIEIVEGPRSSIYGTDAIGGVVNLITRSGGPSGADVMLDYGRYGTAQASLNGNYTDGDTSLRAALSGQHSSGFPAFAVGDPYDSGYQNVSGIVTAATKLADVDLGGFFWRSTGISHYVTGNTYNLDFTQIESFLPLSERFTNTAAAVHAGADLTAIWRAVATLSRVVDEIRQDQYDPYATTATGAPAVAGDFDTTTRDSFDLQNDVKLDGAMVNQLITFGTILTKERTATLSFGTPYAIDTRTETYYAQDQLESGANRLLVAGGYYHHPDFGHHETWNAEYGYSITADTLLIASAGTAFRAPSASDRFGAAGDPNLRPESSRNFELGVKSRLGAYQQLRVSAFQDTITDLIEFFPDELLNIYGGVLENIGLARIRGVEASWELQRDPWSLRVQGSVQDPRNLSAIATDSELIRRSKHSFTLSGSRRFGGAELGVDVLDSGPRQDVDGVSGAPQVRDGGYALTAFWARVSLTPSWSVTARVDNAFDRRYELDNGYNTAGRSASIATRYAFR